MSALHSMFTPSQLYQRRTFNSLPRCSVDFTHPAYTLDGPVLKVFKRHKAIPTYGVYPQVGVPLGLRKALAQGGV